MSDIKREFTGVFVPAHIWTNKELLPAERMILAEIASLSQKTGWCEAGRQHFADWLNCDVTNVSYYTSKLEKLGFLEKQHRPGYKPRMRVVIDRFYVENNENSAPEKIDIPVNPIHGGSEPHSRGVVNPIHGGSEPHSPLKYNINTSIKEEVESTCAALQPPPPKPEKEKKHETIIEMLNSVSDVKRKPSRTNCKEINARLKEGADVLDFKLIIDYKAQEWGASDKMRPYLRPSTLFSAAHFDEYLAYAKKWHEGGRKGKQIQMRGLNEISSDAVMNQVQVF